MIHWRRRSGHGGTPPPSALSNVRSTSGFVFVPPTPFPRLDRANVLILLFAHILWLKTQFFKNFLGRFARQLPGIRGTFSMFCPFAFKAIRITLIFVECITFHQTSLLDDVNKVLAVFTSHKLCFWYVFEYTPHILKYSIFGLTLTLKLPS